MGTTAGTRGGPVSHGHTSHSQYPLTGRLGFLLVRGREISQYLRGHDRLAAVRARPLASTDFKGHGQRLLTVQTLEFNHGRLEGGAHLGS